MGGGRTPSSRSGYSQLPFYPPLILDIPHFILRVQLFHKILSQGGTQAQEQTQSPWSIHAGLQEVEVAVVGHLVNKGGTPGARQEGASGTRALQGELLEEALGMLRPYMMSSGYTSGVVNILYWNLNIKEIQLKFLFMFLVSGNYITLYMVICSRFGFESLVPIY